MSKDLEEIEKQLILDEDLEVGEIKELANRVLHLCKLDLKGFVTIQKPNLTISQRILLVLAARYLANKLQQKLGRESPISEVCETKELASMLREKTTVITARLKDLKDSKKVTSVDRGVFKIISYEISDILSELEGVEN